MHNLSQNRKYFFHYITDLTAYFYVWVTFSLLKVFQENININTSKQAKCAIRIYAYSHSSRRLACNQQLQDIKNAKHTYLRTIYAYIKIFPSFVNLSVIPLS